MIAGRTLQGWLERADELAAKGQFAQAREELDGARSSAAGDEKLVLEGVISLADGLNRLRVDSERREEADGLLGRGIETLHGAGGLLASAPLRTLDHAIAAIKEGRQAPRSMRFALRLSHAEDDAPPQ